MRNLNIQIEVPSFESVGSKVARNVSFFSSEEYLSYGFDNHPSSIQRYKEAMDEITRRRMLLRNNVKVLKPDRASERVLRTFHSRKYIDEIKRRSVTGEGYLDSDTPAFRGMFDVARTVVDASTEAIRVILKGEVDRSFNVVSGLHHAMKEHGSGFCIFNDVAIAISYALEKRSVEKTLYVHIDAHHGDGVFYNFYEDERVWIVDVHQDGKNSVSRDRLRMGNGRRESKGDEKKLFFASIFSDEELMKAMRETARIAMKVNPEMIVLQAGADGIVGDPLAELRYSVKAHSRFIKEMRDNEDEFCEVRLTIFDGGGYNVENCKNAWVNTLDILLH